MVVTGEVYNDGEYFIVFNDVSRKYDIYDAITNEILVKNFLSYDGAINRVSYLHASATDEDMKKVRGDRISRWLKD